MREILFRQLIMTFEKNKTMYAVWYTFTCFVFIEFFTHLTLRCGFVLSAFFQTRLKLQYNHNIICSSCMKYVLGTSTGTTNRPFQTKNVAYCNRRTAYFFNRQKIFYRNAFDDQYKENLSS